MIYCPTGKEADRQAHGEGADDDNGNKDDEDVGCMDADRIGVDDKSTRLPQRDESEPLLQQAEDDAQHKPE